MEKQIIERLCRDPSFVNAYLASLKKESYAPHGRKRQVIRNFVRSWSDFASAEHLKSIFHIKAIEAYFDNLWTPTLPKEGEPRVRIFGPDSDEFGRAMERTFSSKVFLDPEVYQGRLYGGGQVGKTDAHIDALSYLYAALNQGQQMSLTQAPAVETKTFIYGNEASTVSDDQIFDMIRGIEAKIKALQAITAKSSKLEAKIAGYGADILALTKLVDERP